MTTVIARGLWIAVLLFPLIARADSSQAMTIRQLQPLCREVKLSISPEYWDDPAKGQSCLHYLRGIAVGALFAKRLAPIGTRFQVGTEPNFRLELCDLKSTEEWNAFIGRALLVLLWIDPASDLGGAPAELTILSTLHLVCSK